MRLNSKLLFDGPGQQDRMRALERRALMLGDALEDVSDSELCAAAEQAWCEFQVATATYGWRCAELIARVSDEQAWRKSPERFLSFSDWCKAVRLPPSTASRLIDLAHRLRELPEDERKQWRSIGVWDAAEIRRLEKAGLNDAATALVTEQCSGQELRTRVRKELAGLLPGDEEVRQVTFTVPKGTRDLWSQALNVIRFLAGADDPQPSELIEFLAAEIVTLPLPREAELWRAEILNGGVRCKECGSWNSNRLDPHHVLPRSHGGHDGPVVFLCRRCHDVVQPRWREYAEKWGYDVSALEEDASRKA